MIRNCQAKKSVIGAPKNTANTSHLLMQIDKTFRKLIYANESPINYFLFDVYFIYKQNCTLCRGNIFIYRKYVECRLNICFLYGEANTLLFQRRFVSNKIVKMSHPCNDSFGLCRSKVHMSRATGKLSRIFPISSTRMRSENPRSTSFINQNATLTLCRNEWCHLCVPERKRISENQHRN